MEATANILIFIVILYSYALIVWITFYGLKLWFRYTDTKEGYKEAKKEFKAHCKAKERLKHDKNFKIELDL